MRRRRNGRSFIWKDPDGKNDFASEPKKTPDVRDYVPVYEGEEAGFKDEKPAKPQGNRKIRYYRNPMGLPDISSVPKRIPWGWIMSPSMKATRRMAPLSKSPPANCSEQACDRSPFPAPFDDVDPGPWRSPSRRTPPNGRRAALRCLSSKDWSTSQRAAIVRKGEPLMRAL